MTMKQCTKCGEAKPLDQFYPRASSRDGRRNECSVCRRAATRQWNAEHIDERREWRRGYYKAHAAIIKVKHREEYLAKRDQIIADRRRRYYADHEASLAYHREHYKKNRDKKRAYHAEYRRQHPDQPRGAWLKLKYGITLDDYSRMLKEQGGVCAACGAPPTRRRLDVDHDHATGEIRGLLCSACNTTIGRFRDSPIKLARLIRYLQKHNQRKLLLSVAHNAAGVA